MSRIVLRKIFRKILGKVPPHYNCIREKISNISGVFPFPCFFSTRIFFFFQRFTYYLFWYYLLFRKCFIKWPVDHASGWGITWRECLGDNLRRFFEERPGKHRRKCTGQYLGESSREYLGGRLGETPWEYLAFISQENICASVSFLITLQACNLINKETLAQVFSCEFCEIFKNTFFYRTPLVAASKLFFIIPTLPFLSF